MHGTPWWKPSSGASPSPSTRRQLDEDVRGRVELRHLGRAQPAHHAVDRHIRGVAGVRAHERRLDRLPHVLQRGRRLRHSLEPERRLSLDEDPERPGSAFAPPAVEDALVDPVRHELDRSLRAQSAHELRKPRRDREIAVGRPQRERSAEPLEWLVVGVEALLRALQERQPRPRIQPPQERRGLPPRRDRDVVLAVRDTGRISGRDNVDIEPVVGAEPLGMAQQDVDAPGAAEVADQEADLHVRAA